MIEFGLPVVFALLVWWLGTGIVMLLDGMPRDTFRWSLGISTLLAVAALACISRSAQYGSVAGAYAAFTCAVLVWGWHELTFLTGWLTGPRRVACSAPEKRFGQAVAVIAWHELGIAAMMALIVTLTWNAPNQVATWTFLLLWVMRVSAKLNLFLGVRNLGEEFLPEHLRYLRSYFRQRAMNALLLPVVAASSLVAWWLIDSALDTSGAQRVGLLLVASMLSLAIIEHLLLVLPLPSSALWKWALRQPAAVPIPAVLEGKATP